MADLRSLEDFQNKAKDAANKPANLGNDIELDSFTDIGDKQPYIEDPSLLPEQVRETMLQSGIMLDDNSQRSGTFIQINNTSVHSSVEKSGVEILSINQALQKYDWITDYWWQAVSVDADKYTANVELGQFDGYFIRSMPGSRTVFPVQACLYLAKSRLKQNVHNIIIAEEGSELHIITGCASASTKEPALHMGVSEFYIKPRAKVTFTMIHSWNPEIAVRPRTTAIIEEDGLFMSNYVLMKPVKSLQMYPTAHVIGDNATVRYNSILVAAEGSTLDVGSKALLNASKTRAEIVTRAISTGGTIFARGFMEGGAKEVKGHLECRGLILGEKGVIHAVPELKGKLAGIDLSHEAAVGKINEAEIEYLMARGLTRNEATATIVRGFLQVDIEGLPSILDAELHKAISSSEGDFL